MAYLEELIVREPINAKISALDTVTEEWQFSEDGLQYYVERNICKPPRVSFRFFFFFRILLRSSRLLPFRVIKGMWRS